MFKLYPIKPKILSCKIVPAMNAALAKSLIGPNIKYNNGHCSIGLITCDQDDSLYAALDHATKFAKVEVIYAKSFYAGSAHASGPLSGEILGVIAAEDPDHIKAGLAALRNALLEEISFYGIEGREGLSFFPHVIPSIGHYLAAQSGLPLGSALAYLIAPPIESVIALDHALKSANVTLVKYFGPPTETNFGGAYLTGEIDAVEAAARAFTEAIAEVHRHPLL
ncbi:MAG: ethanolamine utilization microcompartment protein EutL [Oligoflexia bacterium]|nr:ethanolamine utilization microcompartment protein EutL [Oligoflexia bacterium]MBF0365218.1 ethanolamine utilization microcompartment protein EutL [Oligoflexia bacterium]